MNLLRTAACLLVLPLAGCFNAGSTATTGGGGPVVVGGETPGEPPGGTENPSTTDPRLKGAGGRDVTEFWDLLAVPLSENVKMLAFNMMANEVKRATAGLTWTVSGVDQWEKNRAAFGGADYVSSFSEDITPSQQKLVLWRRMAYQVCQDAVTRDAAKTTRVLFTDVDPAAAISTSNAQVVAQVKGLYTRFFFDPPSETEVTSSLELLNAAFVDGNDPKEAWRALCVGYLGSMKFLTY